MKLGFYTAFVLSTTTLAADDTMPLWERVAFASDVVVGNFLDKVPSRSEWTESQKRNGLLRTLRIDTTLKGQTKPGERIHVHIVDYLADEPFQILVSSENVLLFLQKDVLLDENRTEYGLTNPPDFGVATASAQLQAEVVAHVREQRRVLVDYLKWSASLRAALPGRLADLGDRLLNPKTREGAVADIFALPESDLWVLIVLIDDRRQFIDTLVFLGPDGSRASHFMTRPQQLVELFCEAMDRRLGLRYINMRSCVTDEKRQFAVNAWRIYLHHRFVKGEKSWQP
jgi:hypothetical protein